MFVFLLVAFLICTELQSIVVLAGIPFRFFYLLRSFLLSPPGILSVDGGVDIIRYQ